MGARSFAVAVAGAGALHSSLLLAQEAGPMVPQPYSWGSLLIGVIVAIGVGI